MSDRKNIVIAALVFVLFFLLFPLRLGSNLNFHSNESGDLLLENSILSENKIPFVFKDRAGYFSTDLKYSWSVGIKDGITLLSDGYINNTRGDNSIVFYDFDGNEKYSVKDEGFPFSISDRLFVLSRDRKSLCEIVNGDKKWTKVFNYIITTISGNEGNIAIGFMNGSFAIVNSNGEIFYDYEPGGSRVSIIYSCALSDDSRYLAIISGLEPQRFIIYEKKESEYRPIYTMNLKDEVRKSLKVFIMPDNRSIFIESLSGFYIVDIDLKTSIFMDADYRLKNVEYIPEFNIYMVHSGVVNYNNIELLTMDYRVLFRKNFIGESVSITTLDQSIYIVIDNSVIKVDIQE